MRAFISVDMEGMPFIVSPEHLNVKKAMYSEARRIMTRITLPVIKTLYSKGFEEIVIADSHGPMINLLVEELPDYVKIIRGFPRPLSMVAGIENSNIAIFLGYHAKAGTIHSSFDHTYSGIIRKLIINGVEVSECLLNAYVAGYYNVPVILVAGERKLIEDDVNKYLPWAEKVILKTSYSRYSSISPSLNKLVEILRKATERAIEKFKKGEMKIFKTKEPVNVEISFISSAYADIAELLPDVKRLNGTSIKFLANNVLDAYKMFELLIIASLGIRSLTI